MSLVQAVARVLVDPDGQCRFRFDSYAAHASSMTGGACHACGTPIADVFWFKHPDGRMVKLGKDCIRSTYKVDPATHKLSWTFGDLGARAAIRKADTDKRIARAKHIARLATIFLEQNPNWGLRPAMQDKLDMSALPGRRNWRYSSMRDDYAAGIGAIESGAQSPIRWVGFSEHNHVHHVEYTAKLGWNGGADLRRPPIKLSDFAAFGIDTEA